MPLIEYSRLPETPEAAIIIVPSSTPHSVGSVKVTLKILGDEGAVSIIGFMLYGVTQVPPTFLTKIL